MIRRLLIPSLLALTALVPIIPTANGGILFNRRCSTPCQSFTACPTYYAPPVYYPPYVAPAVVPVAPVQNVVINNVPAYTPNWKTEILAYAALRDDQQAYLDALNAVGIGGASYSRTTQLGTYGASGNTAYGYSYSSLAAAYGTLDLNTLYQQASRHVSASQQLSGQATTEFGAMVDRAGGNAARVAEILAKAKAAQVVLDATNPQPSAVVTTHETGTAVGPVQPGQQPTDRDAAVIEDTRVFLKTVAVPACASCHTGQNIQGGFDLSSYPTLSTEQKEKVWARIMSNDPAKRMPKVSDGKGGYGPGTPLTAAQKQAFFTH